MGRTKVEENREGKWEEIGEGRVRDRWVRYVSTLEKDFFTSEEARLKGPRVMSEAKIKYRGLSLSERNNYDIKEIYNVKYRMKENFSASVGTYTQLRSAVGQFA